ncbi:MAG: CYTH domain-containing protein [Bacteroidales bacterium]|nr:CYTH domain-containing protein [Bacteroidales bacterium]
MAQEIERKFLVAGDYKSEAYAAVRITQGYLSRVPERVVRVRIKGDKGFITIKGTTNDTGLSRFEWEKEIPLADAQSLLKLAEPGVIDKTRHLIKNTDGKHTWEVDEFHGDNEGLIMAEIELESESDLFDKPSWLGKEVTGDKRYYNAYLSEKPYRLWKNNV